MPPAAPVSSNGSGASGGFGRRASRVLSNAALYQLVEDMAVVLDKQQVDLAEIRELCTRILGKLS